MNKQLRIATYGGMMDLIYLKDFPDKIARSIIDTGSNYLSYPIMDGGTFSQMNVELKGFFQLTGTHMRRLEHMRNIKESFEVEVYLASNQEIINCMKTLVATTMPTFFLKDLDLDAIQNLSREHTMEYGGQDAVGLHIELGPGQKFFVICCPEDFTFHYTQLQEPSRDSVIFRGALVNYKPRKFIMGRYENLEYPNEISARLMFQS